MLCLGHDRLGNMESGTLAWSLEFVDGSDQQQQKGKPLEYGFSVSTNTQTSFRLSQG